MFVVIVVAIIAAGVRDRRRRWRAAAAKVAWCTEALYGWSTARGWRFHPGEATAPWRDRLAVGNRGFTVHCSASYRSPELAATVAICSYQVQGTRIVPDQSGGTQRSGSVKVPVWLTVVILHLPGAWPNLHVRRHEPLVDDGRWLPARFGELPSPAPIRPVLSGHPAFDAQVRAGSPAPEAARTLLTRPIIDAHLNRQLDTWSLCDNDLTLATERTFEPYALDRDVHLARWLSAALRRP
ncbi:hypothetical protein [Actinocatenispora rupis]|uniref:hypothetical protein n=1 Tax=Actinocatenispora rupis TaxID=519421 RepID=UPI001940EB2F|nr:hypothetical protein [Actinocatenispora rupis]